MFTWYSAALPFSITTRCSLIQALRRFRSVSFARVIPSLIASSNPVVDVALISVILATDTCPPPPPPPPPPPEPERG